jgi:hypothetical protein
MKVATCPVAVVAPAVEVVMYTVAPVILSTRMLPENWVESVES